MIIVLRGHIRNSFETRGLYDLIKKLRDIDPDLKIYIHTWNIFANNISWRPMFPDNREINTDIIYNYFDDLKNSIKHIIIDDDTKIELIGNIEGTIKNGPMPIIGWKNYWYGKYKIIEHLNNSNVESNEMIINVRFDILNLIEERILIQFIKNRMGVEFKKNDFIWNYEAIRIDNIYVGNIKTMYKLINCFFYELDDILNNHMDSVHQEISVFRMNDILFA
jgi:hypothetical protein